MNYLNTLLDKLFQINLNSSMKLGLKNMEALNKLFNFPANSFETIHVAGSNGKGSTCIKIAKALEISGLKIGLYTSPHISSFQERIQINSSLISADDTTKHLSEIFKIIELNKIPATFFEITTILALNYFREQKVDVAVLETGLGGRLDATNIVTPKLSIITSISLDHTDILGNTKEEIALEKAGIIKPYVKVVIGPNVPVDTIWPIVLKNKAECIAVKGHYTSYEEENNAIAETALEVLDVDRVSIATGLKAKQPCRFEIIEKFNKIIILDVAHNPDGLRRLFKDIERKFPQKKLRLIFGLSQNKDISECVKILKMKGSGFHLVSANNGRGLSLFDLHKHFLDADNVFCENSIEKAIHHATKFNENLIIICGTFFIMSDSRKALGIQEPSDEIDMNERLKEVYL